MVAESVLAGATFARFRLSSDGVAGPTGRASDGEVEDYRITITEIIGDPRNPVVNISGSATIKNVGGNVVITDGSGEVFNQPLTELDTLTVLGGAGDDTVTYDHGGGSIVPTLGLEVDGGDGSNKLVVVGGVQIDATSGASVSLLNLQRLDLTAEDPSSIRIDSDVASGLAVGSESILYSANTDDKLDFADAADWRMGDPIVDGNLFLLTVVHQVTGKQIVAEVPNSFSNLIDPSDVNNDGMVSASDALAIINELVRHRFSLAEVGTVVDPTTLAIWPNVYGDQSQDDLVTALDALRVINDLARRLRQEGELILPITVSSKVHPTPIAKDGSSAEVRETTSAKASSFPEPASSSVRKRLDKTQNSEADESEDRSATEPAAVDALLSTRHPMS